MRHREKQGYHGFKKRKIRVKKSLTIGVATCIILAIGWTFRLWMPSHGKIHPALPTHFSYSLTLKESDARIRCLQAEIEGISFLAQLDLGYSGVLSLPKHLLDQLTHKCDAGTVHFASIKGKKYESPVFTIPSLNIEDLALVNFPAEEGNLEYERDASLRTKKNLGPSDIAARIGWQAFIGTVVLLDFRKGIAICCDSLETLKEKGYPLEQFVSTHFLPSEQFIEFEANIDNRKVKCIIDTGCTLNLIHIHSRVEESNLGDVDFNNPLLPTMLSIGEHNLGPCVFYKTHLPFGVEAIVGIDFLETQIVCIDFINNTIHLYQIPEDLEKN
jgi:hypothetical protein